MRVGKLSSKELNEIVLKNTAPKRREVLLTAGVAEDCAAISAEGVTLLTTDPITAACKNSGRLALIVAANDVVSSGGEPFCCLLTIIAPPTATAEDVAQIMDEARAAAAELNVDIVGGHTEFSDAVNRTVLSCTMLGKAARVITTGGAAAGEDIILTKTAGIEATSILANDFEERLLKGGLTEKELDEAKAYLFDISVMTEGRVAAKFEIGSMHDITEGGVFGAISELCESAGVGAEIYTEKIPVTPLTQKLCKILGLNPYRLISSGSLIITAKDAGPLIAEINKNGVSAAVIGRVIPDVNRIVAIGGGREENLSVAPDELLKIKR